jgi:hypothetical protein
MSETEDGGPVDRTVGREVPELPVLSYDAGGDTRIEAAKQMDGRTLWKVVRDGMALSKAGEWEWEPMPSSRDAAFLERCRFETVADAWWRLSRSRHIEPSAADTRKPCTCDGAGRGPGSTCRVEAGQRLGDLWRCARGLTPNAQVTGHHTETDR